MSEWIRKNGPVVVEVNGTKFSGKINDKCLWIAFCMDCCYFILIILIRRLFKTFLKIRVQWNFDKISIFFLHQFESTENSNFDKISSIWLLGR